MGSLRVSIHVPLAEHDVYPFDTAVIDFVSIHVPLAEHDMKLRIKPDPKIVSIHVPLAEHDLEDCAPLTLVVSFNSRAPRGARRCRCQPPAC